MFKTRFISMLVLLMTAVTGAWAQEQSESFTTATDGQVTYTGEHFTITGQKADSDGLWIVDYEGAEPTDRSVTISSNNGENITRIEAVIGYTQDWDDNDNVVSTSGDVTGTFSDGETFTISSVNATTVTLSSAQSSNHLIQVKSWTIYYAAAPAASTYTVTLKEGTEDATSWTITPAEATTTGVAQGTEVTATYSGTKKVKSVKAVKKAAPVVTDLSTINANYIASDGETLTGTLASNVQISIADGATVTLNNVTINGTNDKNYEWAGITCLGDATIILSGTNTVKGFYENYPGIQAAAGRTLIINGTGSLTASSYDYAAAIGGGLSVACGNIEIQGGTITATSGGRAGIGGGNASCGDITISGGTVTATGGDRGAGIGGGNASCGDITISGGTVTATGGERGAGIGGGYNASWGNITISGGTVTATGGERGAGIGGGARGTASFSCGNIIISGGTVNATGGDNAAGIGGGRGYNNNYKSSCGTITITTDVTKVTATKGSDAPNSIGAGNLGTCGTVTIGGNVGAITDSPYTYQP